MESNNSSLSIYDDWIAGAVVFISSSSGLVVYILFLTVVFKTKEYYENPYHMLAAALGILDCVNLVVFSFYCAPCFFTGTLIGGETLGILMGSVIVINWYGGLPIVCCLAFNRFYCICRRESYKTAFSNRNTKIMIICSYAFGLQYGIPPLCDCCHQVMYPGEYSWSWDVSQYGGLVISYIELAWTTVTVVLSGVCNTIVFMTYRNLHRAIAADIHGSDQDHIRREREFKLFVQFFVLAAWLTFNDMVYVFGPMLSQSKWFYLFIQWMFTMYTCLNGWIYVILNPSIRRSIMTLFSERTMVESLVASNLPRSYQNHQRRS